MDWIRRNWPDLIIGLALLAVIAGIIATLLSGGSFLPGTSSTADTVSPSATANPSVSTTQETPSVAGGTTEQADAVVAGDTEDSGTTEVNTDAVNDVEAAEAATQEAQADITPIVPSSSADATSESAPTSASAEPSEEGASLTEGATTGEASSAAPVSLEAGTTSSDLPYRISVGSYRDAANAERRAESFSDAGYPTFIGAQDDLSIVLVGPYGTRAEAETAVAEIQRDGLEAAPLLFEFSQETNQGSIVTVPADTADVAGAEASATSATALSTTEGGSYLQAGAYNDSESARPQRERLEGLGLSVSEVQEGSFVKLLAGPFGEVELSAAQATLDAQGIDYFVRGN